VPTLLVMVIWLRFLGGESWRMTAVVSVVTVAAFYALFVLALAIPLPRLV
jgi:putative tricarboxylic transport membrane protein